MTIPKYFRNIGEKNIVSYDYYDIGEGTGIKSFYAGDVLDDYILSSQVFYGDVGRTIITSGNVDIDFDLTAFNTPKTIKGTVLINFGMSRERDGTAGSSLMAYTATIYIRHVRGATETELGNEAVTVSGQMGASAHSVKLHAFQIAIPQTHFKKGDILRVSAIISTTSEFGQVIFAHDPKSRTFTDFADSSQFKIDVPFKLDL